MKKISTDHELIEHFLNSFESAGTKHTYRRSIKQYEKFMEREGITSLRFSTENDVDTFLKERSQNLGRRAIKLQMASLKSLHKFGLELGYFNFNIMSKYKLSKDPPYKSHGELASDEDVLKLLNHIDKDALKGARQHALVCLTFYSFLKITDALNLRLADILKIDGGHVVRVYRQTKEYLVPIPPEAMKSLKEYIDILPSCMTSDSKIFIRTERKGSAFVVGKPFTGAQANTQLRNYRQSAGVSESMTFETIRQAGLRRFVRAGASLNQARKFYGCKSLDTIEAILGPEFHET